MAARIAKPTGTLTKNTHSQPGPDVRTPPKSTPTTAPDPPMPAQTPRARLRSAPWNVVVMIDNAAGDRSAAPTPWATRPTISVVSSTARPEAREAMVNTASPMSRTLRRPSTSASRPPSNIRPPNVSTYAVTTQVSPSRPAARSAPMLGSATFTTVTSTISMNCEAQQDEGEPATPVRQPLTL